MYSQTNFSCCVTGSTAHSTLLQGNEFSLAPSLLAANAANLTRELDVQRRFKSTAMVAQADKVRNHIQIISEMKKDEFQHLQKCVGYKLPIVGNIPIAWNDTASSVDLSGQGWSRMVCCMPDYGIGLAHCARGRESEGTGVLAGRAR